MSKQAIIRTITLSTLLLPVFAVTGCGIPTAVKDWSYRLGEKMPTYGESCQNAFFCFGDDKKPAQSQQSYQDLRPANPHKMPPGMYPVPPAEGASPYGMPTPPVAMGQYPPGMGAMPDEMGRWQPPGNGRPMPVVPPGMMQPPPYGQNMPAGLPPAMPMGSPVPPQGGMAMPAPGAIPPAMQDSMQGRIPPLPAPPPPPPYGTPIENYHYVPPEVGGQQAGSSGMKPWEENPPWKKDLPSSHIEQLKQSINW